ncbi:MAG: hypothetical protein V6Z81_02710 [Parvularculales bacterium]
MGSKEDIRINKSFIETEVGAGVWYLNKSTKFVWTGKISKEAFFGLQKDLKAKLSEEHFYPRKISAIEALQTDWNRFDNPIDEFIDRYLNKYGRFHYVTKEENKRVSIHQRVENFIRPEVAYQKAGIKLIDWTIAKEEIFDTT